MAAVRAGRPWARAARLAGSDKGNFEALLEAIEREQAKRGNL
jgi:4-hydroxyphenylpyruvate dioxygenase-like putative hemolysin